MGDARVPKVKLTPADERHIIIGESGDAKRGGHLFGTGRPGKTEFPAGWDRYKIMEAVQAVIDLPDSVVKAGDRVIRVRKVGGVTIRVSSYPDRETGKHVLHSAYPEFGRGVVFNDQVKGRIPLDGPAG
jgi:hypothetical protein